MTKPQIEKVTSVEDRSLPVFDEFDNVMQRIRDRAYSLFEGRGFAGGDQLDDWFKAEREVCWPAAELEEEDDEFELKVALAGFEPDEVTVTATPREMIVKARHEAKREEEDKDDESELCFSEFRSNEVYRRILLPMEIDVDKVEAKMKHGMLEIEAPKAHGAGSSKKKIDISSAA